MAKLSLDDLDTYSKIAVQLILIRFPGWEDLATIKPRLDGKGNVVEFKIPCPSQAVEFGLFVSTEDEELTVGFHTHHRHFTNYENRLDPVQIHAALDFIEDLLEDRVGVVSFYGAGGFFGSTSVELPHEDRLLGLWEGLGLTNAKADIHSTNGEVKTLRSWSGRFDRDEACA